MAFFYSKRYDGKFLRCHKITHAHGLVLYVILEEFNLICDFRLLFKDLGQLIISDLDVL